MFAAWYRLSAWFTARYSLNETCDVFSFFVSTIAQLDGELCARGAVVFAVTGVSYGMVAVMGSRAQFFALWRFSATRNRRIQDRATTGAGQLIKANTRTGLAVATVTKASHLCKVQVNIFPQIRVHT